MSNENSIRGQERVPYHDDQDVSRLLMSWHPVMVQAREVLRQVDAGEVKLQGTEPDSWVREGDTGSWEEVYAGTVIFVLDNGWRIGVFNDCDSWDYVDWVQPPDGERWGVPFTSQDGPYDDIFNWAPAGDVYWDWVPRRRS